MLKSKGRKLVGIVLSLVLVCGLCIGCDSAGSTGTVDETIKKEVADAMANLQTKDKYLINNQLSAPDGNSSFVEIVSKGDSYSEYPVQQNVEEEGASAKDTQYTMQDWCCLDGSAYINVNETWYKYPDDYGAKLASRNVLFADKIIPALTSLEKLDEKESADIGDGTEEFTIYMGTCPAEVITDILGISTKVVYESIINQYKEEEKYKDEIHLAELYLSDLEKTLTFSDATVEFAVDKDNILRELNFTVGGLGTKLKYFRAVALKADYEDLEKPSELKADNIPSIIDTLTESAEFAKDYDNYDEMVRAYQEKLIAEQEAQATATPDATEDSKKEEEPESTKKPKKSREPKVTESPEATAEAEEKD